MSGALFIITLPTASYENLPAEGDSNSSDKNTDKPKDQAIEGKEPNLIVAAAVTPKLDRKPISELHVENETNQGTDPEKSQFLFPPSKKLSSNFSASTPSIQDLMDNEPNEDITHLLRRPLPLSKSAGNLKDELLEVGGKPAEDTKSSLLSLGKRIVSAFTPVKDVADAASIASKIETKVDKSIPLQTLLSQVLEKLGVDAAVWSTTKNGNFYQVTFNVESGDECEDCIQQLNECGIGIRPNTTVSVIPCTLFYKGEDEEELIKEEELGTLDEMEKGQKKVSLGCMQSGNNDEKVWNWNKFVASVRSRLMVAQVVESVRANAELTFDFILLLLVAGIVAAIGLVENNSVVLVASMLISPLMGPILAGTFGAVIQDRNLQKIGVFNELLGLILCIAVGFIFGLIVGLSSDHYSYPATAPWPTNEMTSRGIVRCLWVGVLIALPSGVGVAISILGGNAGSLVGVAISASLLPPAVNAGLLWALAVIKAGSRVEELPKNVEIIFSESRVVEYATLGAVSLCLTILNIASIFVVAVLVLKIKEVAPQFNRDEMKQFWKYDVKVARDYNKTMHGEEAKDLQKELLEEMSHISQDLLCDAKHKRRFSIRRHISDGGSIEGLNSYGRHANEHTWTPDSNQAGYRGSLIHPSLFRTSVSGPTEEEVENLVYSTLSGATRCGIGRNFGKPGVRPSFRKKQAMSLPYLNQPKSPTKKPDAHLGTITESSSIQNTPCVSQQSVNKRFHVTRYVDEKQSHRQGKAPIAKSDD